MVSVWMGIGIFMSLEELLFLSVTGLPITKWLPIPSALHVLKTFIHILQETEIAWKQLGRTFNNKTILAKLLTAVISNHFLLNFLIGVTAERGFE